MRRSLALGLAIAAAAVAALALVAYVLRGGGRAHAPAVAIVLGKRRTIQSRACERNPHDGVHVPDRLQVLSPCASFQGTVSQTPEKNRHDGDVNFNVLPAPGYANMLNTRNRSQGGLHIEIVPRDQPGCKRGQPIHFADLNDLGVCSGRHLAAPRLGAHVRIIGPWVFDSNNHWYEIHPAWSITPAPGVTR